MFEHLLQTSDEICQFALKAVYCFQPKEMVIETAPELSHDDKENKNPNDQAGTSSNKDPVVDDEPGPSTSGSSAPNKKRRRILCVFQSLANLFVFTSCSAMSSV